MGPSTAAAGTHPLTVQALAVANGADRKRPFAAGDARLDRLVASLAARFHAPAATAERGA